MSYTNYKKISYILSEKPGLSGQIAFEFLKNIIHSNDVLEFAFWGHGQRCDSFELLMQMYNDITILPSKTNEKVIVIRDFTLNNKLKEVLCELGMFPNFLKISKIATNLDENQDDLWSIEFSDEILVFAYKTMDNSKIITIEQSFLNKGMLYERKEIKK